MFRGMGVKGNAIMAYMADDAVARDQAFFWLSRLRVSHSHWLLIKMETRKSSFLVSSGEI